MSRAWLAFARHGRPDHAGLPAWPGYSTAGRATMIFDIKIAPLGVSPVSVFTTAANRPTAAIAGTTFASGVVDGLTKGGTTDILTVEIAQVGSTIAGSDFDGVLWVIKR